MGGGFSPSRRRWLKAGGLLLAVSAGGTLWAEEAGKRYGADSLPGGVVEEPLVFVGIAADGTVTIVAHRPEMGTGIRTSLPMVVADEMNADWARVKVVQADADEARYGSQNVDGSRSMRHFLQPMRRVGAAMRHMLEASAAAHWQVPAQEVRAVLHAVEHLPSGRRLGYGELAAEALRQPVLAPEQLRLKAPPEFLYIGKEAVRPYDTRDIVTGRAVYGIDVSMPDMLCAVMARPPVLGSRAAQVDADAARKVPGVLDVVQLDGYPGAPLFHPLGGVAVVARNTWAAMRGRAALKVAWGPSPHDAYDSAGFRQELAAAVQKPGKVLREQGDAYAALAAGEPSRRVQAEYYLPHLAHATMEPPVATALYKDGRCEVWAPVQAPQGALDAVAAHLQLKPGQVTLHPTLLGGGFGRKAKPDFVVEAALLARRFEGRPVKLVWTREDDIRHDYLHTVSVERLESVLDGQGRPQAWLHRSAAPTIMSLFVEGAALPADFEYGMGAVNVPFQVPHLRVEAAAAPAHARIGWFRSVSNIPHAFAVQSFVAELAHQAGRDHRDYLLELIGPPRRIDPAALGDHWNYSESPQRYPLDTGRMRAVVERATREAGWGRKLPPGRGLGLAVASCSMSYVAAVIEVEVAADGAVRVDTVDMAVDCGPQVHPERVRAQAEGGCIMGLGLALMGEISFREGRVVQSNFHDFPVPRLAQAPRRIRVHAVGADFSVPPGGAGEPMLPPIAPALANAIFAATGRRVRSLPISRVAPDPV